jgi:hypothetical protein
MVLNVLIFPFLYCELALVFPELSFWDGLSGFLNDYQSTIVRVSCYPYISGDLKVVSIEGNLSSFWAYVKTLSS